MEGHSAGNSTDAGGILSTGTSLHKEMIHHCSPVMTGFKVCIGITGVVGNMLVVIIVCKHKTLFRRQVKSVYIVNQSFIDGLASAVLVLQSLLRADLMSVMGIFGADMYCKFWVSQVPLWGLMLSSTYNLVAISIERYIAIVHPIWHRTSFTVAKSRVSLVVIWLFGLSYLSAVLVPESGVVDGVCHISYFYPACDVPLTVHMVRGTVSWLLPLVLHCVCYSRILIILRTRVATNTNVSVINTQTTSTRQAAYTRGSHHTPGHAKVFPSASVVNPSFRDTMPGQTTSANALVSERQRQYENTRKNVIKTFALVTACYFICWTPHKVYITMYNFGLVCTFGSFFQAMVMLAFINCCINPFIYIAKFDAFKMAVFAMFE